MNFKSNIDKVIPQIQEYKLPSGGLAYTLNSKEKFPTTIRIKPYGFTTEGILMSNLESGEKMASVFRDVVDLPEGFDPKDLLIADQHYVLAVARALTYGEDYTFFTTCPACNVQERHVLKVPDEVPTRLWVADKKDAREDGSAVWYGGMTVRLPVIGDTLELRFLTTRDIDGLNAYAEQKSKISNQDSSYMRRVCMHIKSINGSAVGSKDWHDLETDYLPRIRGADMVALRDGMEKLAPGFIQQWNVSCDKCSREYTDFIPILSNFFRRV